MPWVQAPPVLAPHLSMPLLRVSQVNHVELFALMEECLTHCALLLLLIMVPQLHLRTWHWTLSFASVVGKPTLPHNL